MKYSVLTFIFGGYEPVREVTISDPDAEYILVTDDDSLTSDTWTIVRDERLSGMSIIDKCYYVRYHPFEYVHSEICVKIDGSIRIIGALSPLIGRFEKINADLSLMINPHFSHLHEDYDLWVKYRNYPSQQAQRCLSKLASMGYDPSYRGYYQIGFMIERKNDVIKRIDDTVYQYLLEFGVDGVIERFDQPVWSFVINKHFSESIKVMPVNEYLITFSPYLQWYFHNSEEVIPFNMNMIDTFLFNKRIRTSKFDYWHSLKYNDKKLIYLKRFFRSALSRLAQ